jgi:stage III sporulation protein AB
MTRFFGAIFIVAGCAMWGFMGAFRLKRRHRAIASVARSLLAVQSEICDRLTPMPELLRRLSEESGGAAGAFYKNAYARFEELGERGFAAVWREAVEATPELMLTPEEATVLCDLSRSLGRYDIDEQRGAIEYARRRFEDFAQKADLSREKDGRLRAFLGVAAGVLVAIILI